MMTGAPDGARWKVSVMSLIDVSSAHPAKELKNRYILIIFLKKKTKNILTMF
ncbi:hypothetical Protein YC6258_01729 [Gynuella sunshinyii YC6258]|uniref:Uncharacterized protein n=1 Tax=Gynuella sunshinyii YC6258 TaxID=1445510 RepID=A0A0C5V2S1_9GAMM|nr:hypothetical Protein YC6258_01729 [Gynuella sunshinyii YC6258]